MGLPISVGDIFPIPVALAPGRSVPTPSGSLPPVEKLLCDFITTANDLDAGGSAPTAYGELTSVQAAVLASVSPPLARFADLPVESSDEQAFADVCGGLDYHDDPTTFSPLEMSRLSLRPPGARPRPLSDLLGPHGASLSDVNSCMEPDDRVAHKLKEAELEIPFMDPGVRRSQKLYGRLLRRMRDAGMLDFVGADRTDLVREMVGIFAVEKEFGKQRVVIYCRRSNCHFVPPPRTALPTCAGYSRLHLEPGDSLWSGGFDLKDAFYQLELPYEFRRFFCLPQCSGRMLGLVGPEADLQFVPRLAVVPMGWTHALHVCQTIFTSIIREALHDKLPFVDDHAPSCSLRRGVVSCYVDNFGVMSTSAKVCREAVSQDRDLCITRGLEFHEFVEAAEGFEYLGMCGTRDGIIATKSARRVRLYQALRHARRRGRMSSHQLECLVGHFTSQALLKRESLCMLRAVYCFIKRKFKRSTALWPAVNRELQWMESVVPLLEVDAKRSWSGKVYCFDASEWGEGVQMILLEPEAVASIGAYSERWIFRSHEPPSRELAHQAIMDSLLAAQDHEALDKYLEGLRKRSNHKDHRMVSAAETYAASFDPSRHLA